MLSGRAVGGEFEICNGELKVREIGQTGDFKYAVPENTKLVDFRTEVYSEGITIGNGVGAANLYWVQGSREANVHAWVNGCSLCTNRITWTLVANTCAMQPQPQPQAQEPQLPEPQQADLQAQQSEESQKQQLKQFAALLFGKMKANKL